MKPSGSNISIASTPFRSALIIERIALPPAVPDGYVDGVVGRSAWPSVRPS
jgi:hypothetical protein